MVESKFDFKRLSDDFALKAEQNYLIVTDADGQQATPLGIKKGKIAFFVQVSCQAPVLYYHSECSHRRFIRIPEGSF